MLQEEEELELGDFLLIAEGVLEIRAEDIVNLTKIPVAESALAAPFASFGGEIFYRDPAERGAILCSRIIRNHPLPDGNKRVGYECMREQLFRAGCEWANPAGGAREIAATIEALAARDMSEGDFVQWVKDRCR